MGPFEDDVTIGAVALRLVGIHGELVLVLVLCAIVRLGVGRLIVFLKLSANCLEIVWHSKHVIVNAVHRHLLGGWVWLFLTSY